MSNFFDVGADAYKSSVTTEEEVKSNPDFYKPNLSDTDNKLYKARIRFIPNIKDPNVLAIRKMGYYLQFDPDNTESRGFWLDCTSNVGSNKPNIISRAYWDLSKSESAHLRNVAMRNFKRKTYYWMLVYVMMDQVHPELNDTVKIMRFGNQIKKLHDKELEEDRSMGKHANIFYHPLKGKDFMLIINEKTIQTNGGKSMTITNYEDSSFESSTTPFGFVKPNESGDGNLIERISSDEDKNRLIEYLNANSPDLSQVEFQPWDDFTTDKAIRTVRGLIDNDKVFDQIYFKTYGKRFSSATPKGNQATVEDTESDSPGQEADDVISQVTKQNNAPAKQAVTNAESEATTGADDEFDFDDIGDDFDLDDLD
jgi:hypothetical protein